jgi:hypothetical protein
VDPLLTKKCIDLFGFNRFERCFKIHWLRVLACTCNYTAVVASAAVLYLILLPANSNDIPFYMITEAIEMTDHIHDFLDVLSM